MVMNDKVVSVAWVLERPRVERKNRFAHSMKRKVLNVTDVEGEWGRWKEVSKNTGRLSCTVRKRLQDDPLRFSQDRVT